MIALDRTIETHDRLTCISKVFFFLLLLFDVKEKKNESKKGKKRNERKEDKMEKKRVKSFGQIRIEKVKKRVSIFCKFL